MKFKKLVSLGVLSTLLLSVITGCSTDSSGSDSKSDSKTKGDLTVYTAIEEDSIEPYLATFKEKYPDIKLNIVRASTGDITARILAEKDNPQADIIWGLSAMNMIELKKDGALEAYKPKNYDKVDKKFKDTEDDVSWVGMSVPETAIVVNYKELKKLGIDIPKSYEDLKIGRAHV